ncbi:MAG TPA: hypothetical protein VLA56_03160 [Pseudomonadales bacterium]|nr:hypothetical protein [Pseudomonadales bacterium]
MQLLPPVIARRTLRCQPPGEAERLVEVLVRAPVPDAGQWVCEAALENLYRDVARARGVDSMQALQLALDTVRGTLTALIEAGGQVDWPDGSGRLDPENLLR